MLNSLWGAEIDIYDMMIRRYFHCICAQGIMTEEKKKQLNWFERHINWTTGIFGYLIVFILLFFAAFPFRIPFTVDFILDRLFITTPAYRSPEYGTYQIFFIAFYIVMAIVLSLVVNIWYLRIKRQRYRHLWWLVLPPVILLFAVVLSICLIILNQSLDFGIVMWSVKLMPLWLSIVAFMLLRLENKNPSLVKESVELTPPRQ